MSGETPRLNPLESRKRLLMVESELNRARLVGDLGALAAGVGALAERARSFGSVASSAAVLVAGLAGVAAVRRVRQHFKARGTLEPRTHRCGRKTHLTPARKERLLRRLDRRPDATLAELGAQLGRPTSTVGRWLTRLDWSCKKTRPAAEQSRPAVAEQRNQWPQRLVGVATERLVFVDESGANPQRIRRCGRGPIGQRRACPGPHGP